MLYLISPFNGHNVSALAPPHPRPASDDITEPEFVGSRQPQLPAEGDCVQHHRFISDTESSEHLTSSDRYSVNMAEESRGKRRKQANPRRNQGRTHFMLLWYIWQDKKMSSCCIVQSRSLPSQVFALRACRLAFWLVFVKYCKLRTQVREKSSSNFYGPPS